MGLTKVLLTVKNLKDPSRKYEGKFLVDSGAMFTVVPSGILKDLGIKPEREEEFDLADGTSIRRKVGNALYEFQGVRSAAPIMFGEKGDASLLGVLTLEALGLTLDPLKRELHKATLRM